MAGRCSALFVIAAALAAAALAAPQVPAETGTAAPHSGAATVVYLVRHAEKASSGTGTEGPGPPLSEEGKLRAEQLANTLRAEGITHIYSTGFARTMETAGPLAGRLGVKIETYDPKDLKGFARKLAALPGRHLVVGHSNTTPELVELLGGDAGPPIDEQREYDRLYVLVLSPGGKVTTLHLRYGPPFSPSRDGPGGPSGGGL